MAPDSEIKRLLDEGAVRDVILRYARGVDRLDWELVRSCFHPAAVLEYGDRTDVEGFIEGARRGLPVYLLTQHSIMNILIDVDHDTAWSEAYCQARHRSPGGDGAPFSDFLWGGRYVDRFERRDGAWKIAHRVVVHEWTSVEPVHTTWPHAVNFTQGRRDLDDIVYRREELLAPVKEAGEEIGAVKEPQIF